MCYCNGFDICQGFGVYVNGIVACNMCKTLENKLTFRCRDCLEDLTLYLWIHTRRKSNLELVSIRPLK